MFSKPHSIPFERKKQKAIFHHLTIVVQCALHVYGCVILFSSFISTSHDWLLSIYSCRRAFRFVSSGRKRMAVVSLKWLSYHFDQTFFDTSPCNVWSKLPRYIETKSVAICPKVAIIENSITVQVSFNWIGIDINEKKFTHIPKKSPYKLDWLQPIRKNLNKVSISILIHACDRTHITVRLYVHKFLLWLIHFDRKTVNLVIRFFFFHPLLSFCSHSYVRLLARISQIGG